MCSGYINFRIAAAAFILLVGSFAVLAAGIAGDWKGESICTIKTSPCHDEQVIYHISEPDAGGKFTIRADKLVNGQPESMGDLDCTFHAPEVKCLSRGATWAFTVSGNKMTGTLTLADGRLYRRVSVTKDSK
jgi:hypothetical protein